MLLAVKPAVQNLLESYERRGEITRDSLVVILVVILLVVLASAWVTESLGVHALFGAFLAGAIMPRHRESSHELWRRFEALTVTLLSPLYFAFTGLRSSFLLIIARGMWLYCAIIIALAIIGKFGGSLAAARLSGVSWRLAR
jgi:Kef-type K+ transport system membrane component KefB